MKRWLTAMWLVAWAAVAVAGARAEQPASQGKIRVLLTFGGHGFEEKPFFAMFDAMSGITYTKAQMPKAAELFKPGLEKQFDVIVMYDMVGAIKPDEQKAFVALLNQGIGLVSLHHNLAANAKWDEFRKIIGGKFILADCEIDGKKWKKSGWDHDQDLKVTVADKSHPITKGIDNFQIHDETYSGYYVAPNVHVLLTTDHPKNTPQLSWVSRYGKSPVFYLMLGHDGKAYQNPAYSKLVYQGIRWAAGR